VKNGTKDFGGPMDLSSFFLFGGPTDLCPFFFFGGPMDLSSFFLMLGSGNESIQTPAADYCGKQTRCQAVLGNLDFGEP